MLENKASDETKVSSDIQEIKSSLELVKTGVTAEIHRLAVSYSDRCKYEGFEIEILRKILMERIRMLLLAKNIMIEVIERMVNSK